MIDEFNSTIFGKDFSFFESMQFQFLHKDFSNINKRWHGNTFWSLSSRNKNKFLIMSIKTASTRVKYIFFIA